MNDVYDQFKTPKDGVSYPPRLTHTAPGLRDLEPDTAAHLVLQNGAHCFDLWVGTRGKFDEYNQDWSALFPAAVGHVQLLGDVASSSSGIDPAAPGPLASATLGALLAEKSPVDALACAHTRLKSRWEREGAKVGMSILAVQLIGERLVVTNAGDCSSYRYTPQTWCRRSCLALVSPPQKEGFRVRNQFAASVSFQPVVTDLGVMRAGDVVMCGSDGVFHDNINDSLEVMHAALKESSLSQNLSDLGRQLFALAVRTRRHRDDATLALIRYCGARTGEL